MRVLLLSHSEVTRNPRARPLARSLVAAGHDVVAVCGGAGSSPLPEVAIRRIPTRVPRRWGRLGWLLRRIQPSRARRAIFERSFAKAAAATGADLIYPMSRADLATAMAVATPQQAIVREPHWETAGGRDIADLAPYSPAYSSSPAGPPLPFYTPEDSRSGHSSEEGRHAGVRIDFVAQPTKTTPARYLANAAERAGMIVTRHEGALDWDDVHPDTAAVVFVESPYPALHVTGENRHGIPVLFWVHHGEHHLPANLRLVERYGVHAVLLAHSWHLAHRFPVPVHRFPFAVAPEIQPPYRPLTERTNDVAMVGAGVEGGTGRYARRQQLVDALKRQCPHTHSFAYGVPPEAMAEIYGDARIVLNEGGDRHQPITMRVFEATGAGALLLTDQAPGLDLLFEPGKHYEVIGSDIAAQVADLLGAPTTEDRAAAGHRHATRHHLYDHRIDDLIEIAAATEAFDCPPLQRHEGVVGLIEDDLEVQEIALFGIDAVAPQLDSHVLWDGSTLLNTSHDRVVDAVVLGPRYRQRIDTAADRASRYIYAFPTHHSAIANYARNRWPDSVSSTVGEILRIDLGAKSYRVRTAGHPLADA